MRLLEFPEPVLHTDYWFVGWFTDKEGTNIYHDYFLELITGEKKEYYPETYDEALVIYGIYQFLERVITADFQVYSGVVSEITSEGFLITFDTEVNITELSIEIFVSTYPYGTYYPIEDGLYGIVYEEYNILYQSITEGTEPNSYYIEVNLTNYYIILVQIFDK